MSPRRPAAATRPQAGSRPSPSLDGGRSAKGRPAVPRTHRSATPAARSAPAVARVGPVSSPRVSTTSAQRFARRVRHRRWRRILWVALGVALLAGAVWGVYGSPWLRLRSVEVHGLHRIPASAVQSLAASDVGDPMLAVSTDALAERIQALRLVKDASVERVWPGSLRVTVEERLPVAAIAHGGQVQLVDDEGVVVETRSTWPARLPRVDVDMRTQGPLAMAAALRVREALPAGLLAEVRRLGADSPDGVWLRLANGSLVRWGNEHDAALKVKALQALRKESRHAGTYDVSSPSTPAYAP
jgi:cell division protein FtsQ